MRSFSNVKTKARESVPDKMKRSEIIPHGNEYFKLKNRKEEEERRASHLFFCARREEKKIKEKV